MVIITESMTKKEKKILYSVKSTSGIHFYTLTVVSVKETNWWYTGDNSLLIHF